MLHIVSMCYESSVTFGKILLAYIVSFKLQPAVKLSRWPRCSFTFLPLQFNANTPDIGGDADVGADGGNRAAIFSVPKVS